MTIEDRQIIVESWVMPTRVLRAGGGDGILAERRDCEVYETDKFTTPR